MRPVKASVDTINNRLDWMQDDVSSNTEEIAEVRSIAVNNTLSISQVAIKYDTLEQKLDFDSIQNELNERERRSRNLLIHQVPEAPSHGFPSDFDFVTDIITKINMEIN